jgi:putative flippase GtrA
MMNVELYQKGSGFPGMHTLELPRPVYLPEHEQAPASPSSEKRLSIAATFRQLLRFCLVGCLNTVIDLLTLNALFWLFPTRSVGLLLIENSIAYSFGAVNSFLFNKYWTFRCGGRVGRREVGRFALTTLAGVACNNLLLWLLSTLLHPVFVNAVLWANVSKIVAIGGTVLISYLDMRLWVFVRPAPVSGRATIKQPAATPTARSSAADWPPTPAGPLATISLSVVLPIYNEAETIEETVERTLRGVAALVSDFELILVNDGSTDATGALLASFAADPRVRIVTHARNQGYGAALVDGFAAANKALTFFTDSDGQFDIADLARLLPFIDEYDAVIGYRQQRQDSWLRKLNAWGWKLVVRLALGVRARDIDCAFKLLRTSFLRRYPLETRGAMINAELLYKLRRAGCTWCEVGVRHFPRRGGRATGANLRVIARAFRELVVSARAWRCEENVSR